MGLAFTDTTTKLTDDENVTDGSFYIDHSTPHDDAIPVRGDHLRADYDGNIDKEIIPPRQGEACLSLAETQFLPYLSEAMVTQNWKEDPKDVNDYGVIIRHTHREGEHKQIRLIVAGLTEDGTVVLARCHVSRQNDLYEVYKKFEDDRTNPEGDFVVVISGPTKSDHVWNDRPIIAFSRTGNTRSVEPPPLPSEVWAKIRRFLHMH